MSNPVNPFMNDYPTYNPRKYQYVDELKSERDIKYEEAQREIEYLKHDILYVGHATVEKSKHTINDLDKQEEIIEKMNPKLKDINRNLNQSETILGIIQNKLNKFAFWKGDPHPKINLNKSKDTNNPTVSENDLLDGMKCVGHQITEEEFTDELMLQLNQLKNNNKEIGKQLNRQNNKLDDINDAVHKETEQTHKLNKNIKKLLR